MSAQPSIGSRRPLGLTIVGALAVVQAVFELVLAVIWLRYGTQLEGRGLLLLPILSLLFVLRGVMAAVLAALYLVFARGALARSDWAWWLGLCLAVLTTLGTIGLIAAGEPVPLAGARAIIPLVLLGYLLSAGRAALTPAHE